MSSHLQVYVGAFFLVPKQTFTERQIVHVCSNDQTCGQQAKTPQDNFCGYCGSLIAATTKDSQVTRYPTPDDLAGNWTDVMVPTRLEDGRQVWLPNKGGHGQSYSDDVHNAMWLFDGKDILAARTQLCSEYNEIANAFQAKFGVELVDAFGAVPYYS
jgi:hypothetical protein